MGKKQKGKTAREDFRYNQKKEVKNKTKQKTNRKQTENKQKTKR